MTLPELGVGIVYLPGLGELLEAGRDLLDVVEVEPQPFCVWKDGGYRFRDDVLHELQGLPQAKLVHGVGAPVGGEVFNELMLRPYVECIRALRAPWASEHLTFTRVATPEQTYFTGFMLPPLQTPDSVAVAVSNILRIKAEIGVPFAFETPVNYMKPRPEEMSDGAFFAQVARQSDAGILLDLYNVWCNERNGRQPVDDLLEELPLERVWEIHMADGRQFEGYWVDAHSGLISDDLFELAAHVIPRLPNLKAMLFEIMPDYLAAEGITTGDVVRQTERMRDLWERRGSVSFAPRDPVAFESNPSVPVHRWEAALGGLVTRQAANDSLMTELEQDPGCAVYRLLAESVRSGMVADSLPLTYRLLMLKVGENKTQELLERFWDSEPPRQFAIEEARSFANWLSGSAAAPTIASEVAAFELATYEVRLTGESQTVGFSREPTSLLSALGAGHLPGGESPGRYNLTIEA